MDLLTILKLSLAMSVQMCQTFSTVKKSLEAQTYLVNVGTERCVHETKDEFLSVAIDSGLIRYRWKNFSFISEKLKNLARGMYPAFLRIGGTDEDFLIYTGKANGQSNTAPREENNRKLVNFTMSASDVDNIFHFSTATGLSVIFGLNVLLRNPNMDWDTTNARKLMTYIASRRYRCGWELGNEPVDFKGLVNVTITAKQLAKDFQTLRGLLNDHREYGQMIVGPDVSSPWRGQIRPEYLTEFLLNIHETIDAVTYHQYYTNNKAPVTEFYSPKLLDSLVSSIQELKRIMVRSGADYLPLWLGETSSAYGGGVPDVSDSYVAGFMWLDKLGVAARLGHEVVVRQTFYGGSYSMINLDTLDPFPDYWSSLLYKRLVGTKVLDVYDGLTLGRKIRVYAHCASTRSYYAQGSIVIIALNTLAEETQLELMPELKTFTIEQYLLTPGSDGNLTSHTVKLNGEDLTLTYDLLLPVIVPKVIEPPRKIILPPLSYGFFVVPGVNAAACRLDCIGKTANKRFLKV